MIKTERIGSVAIIKMDRPDRRNALGSEQIAAISDALKQFDEDKSTGAIVVSGSQSYFCAGSDLKELSQLSVEAQCEHEVGTAAFVRSIAALSKPVIASVEGYALGGGFMFAVGCDVVVSAEDALWHLPEVGNGFIPIWGMRALMSRVGPSRARLLSWGAETMDGLEAQRMGIVDYTAKPGEAFARALTIAKALAALPPEAVASVKRYFEPYAQVDAEKMDASVIEIFANDSKSSAAKATWAEYSKKRL